MPEKRGRRRRARDRRGRADAPIHADAGSETAPAAPEQPRGPVARAAAVPSNTARATGVAIAAITVFLAVMLIADASGAGRSTIDVVARLAAGGFLVLLGIAVGVLSLFPAQLRRMIRGE
jgi:hypothetical protein